MKERPTKTTTLLRTITLAVITVHAALILFFVLQTEGIKPKHLEKRLIVKTIDLTPPTKQSLKAKKAEASRVAEAPPPEPVPSPPATEIAASEPVVEQAPEPEQPEPVKPKPVPEKKVAPKKPAKPTKPKPTAKAKKPEPKKTAQKAKPVKKEATKPKTQPKKSTQKEEKKPDQQVQKVDPSQAAAKAKKRALLENAQKSIAKMEHTRDKLSAAQTSAIALADAPGRIEHLHIESATGEATAWAAEERGYHEELASRLKLLLRLPEYGEVKVKLTLKRSGKFAKVVTVRAGSSKNQKYIEKTLPTLTYPSFGDHFGDREEHTFVITLSND